MHTTRMFVSVRALAAIMLGLVFSLNFAALPVFAQMSDDYGTPESGSYCPKISITMQRGARDVSYSGQVSELQKFISDYYDIDPDEVVTGFFGRITQGYVQQFQREQGLPSFGIAGSLTRASIAKVCASSTFNNTSQATPITTPATSTPNNTQSTPALNYSALPTADIDASSLNSVSQAPVITGSASGASTIVIELKSSGTQVVSDRISVTTNGRWIWIPPIAIQNGVYVVNVLSIGGINLVSKTLTVGALANYNACRLDTLDGSNITRDAITDQYTCLAKICDMYGPANLPHTESKCVFNGSEIKRYTNPIVLNITAVQMSNTLAPQNAIVPFTTFTLADTGSQPITVNGITINKVGAIGNTVTTASDAVFTNVFLRDESNMIVGSTTSLDSNHQANLGGIFTIMPGQTKTLTVYGTMAANNSADNSNVVGLSVTAISTAANLSGALPISGARDTINTSLQCSPVYGYECANQ